jgi:hypothetical protein
VLVAFAPTAQPAGVDCRLCEAGLWEVELRLADPKAGGSVTLDAWIERDDPAGPQPAPRTHFADQLLGDEHHTVSSIATGMHTIKAFGFNRESGRAAPYSSLPPAPLNRHPHRAGLLQVMAVCEEDLVHPGIEGAATRSGDSHRMKGTSVAAPLLARQLYAVLEAAPPGRPVRRGDWPAILRQLCDDPSLDTVQPLQRD